MHLSSWWRNSRFRMRAIGVSWLEVEGGSVPVVGVLLGLGGPGDGRGIRVWVIDLGGRVYRSGLKESGWY